MSKPKHDYSAAIAAYKAAPTIADALPDILKEILHLHYIENLRWRDVADAKAYSVENIYRLRISALGRLEDIINGK